MFLEVGVRCKIHIQGTTYYNYVQNHCLHFRHSKNFSLYALLCCFLNTVCLGEDNSSLVLYPTQCEEERVCFSLSPVEVLI